MNKDICNIEDATYIDEVKDHIGTSVGKVEGFREERFNKANEDMKKMQEAIWKKMKQAIRGLKGGFFPSMSILQCLISMELPGGDGATN